MLLSGALGSIREAQPKDASQSGRDGGRGDCAEGCPTNLVLTNEVYLETFSDGSCSPSDSKHSSLI